MASTTAGVRRGVGGVEGGGGGARAAGGALEVATRLRLLLGCIGRGGQIYALVGDPVAFHERPAHRPELGRVHGVRRAVALVVVLAVAATLAGLEPGDRWPALDRKS